MFIHRCTNCQKKKVSNSRKALHTCDGDITYEMESHRMRIEVSSKMLDKIRLKFKQENLITDDAHGFGANLNFPLKIALDHRKKGFLRTKSWNVDESEVKQALSEIFDQKVRVQFIERDLIKNRQLKKVKIWPPHKERDKIRKQIIEEIEENDQ